MTDTDEGPLTEAGDAKRRRHASGTATVNGRTIPNALPGSGRPPNAAGTDRSPPSASRPPVPTVAAGVAGCGGAYGHRGRGGHPLRGERVDRAGHPQQHRPPGGMGPQPRDEPGGQRAGTTDVSTTQGRGPRGGELPTTACPTPPAGPPPGLPAEPLAGPDHPGRLPSAARGRTVADGRDRARSTRDGPNLPAPRRHPHLLHRGCGHVRPAPRARHPAPRELPARGNRVGGRPHHHPPRGCCPRSTPGSNWPTPAAGSTQTVATPHPWPPVVHQWCSTPTAR